MTILHHYTTPARAERVLDEGLQPRSLLPGSADLVSFAFLDEAHLAWPGLRHDENPGLNTLYSILLRSREEEGPEGISRISFGVVNPWIYERGIVKDREAYLASKRSFKDYRSEERRYLMPEAGIDHLIKADHLMVTEQRLGSDALDIFDAYGFFQKAGSNAAD